MYLDHNLHKSFDYIYLIPPASRFPCTLRIVLCAAQIAAPSRPGLFGIQYRLQQHLRIYSNFRAHYKHPLVSHPGFFPERRHSVLFSLTHAPSITIATDKTCESFALSHILLRSNSRCLGASVLLHNKRSLGMSRCRWLDFSDWNTARLSCRAQETRSVLESFGFFVRIGTRRVSCSFGVSHCVWLVAERRRMNIVSFQSQEDMG